MSSVIVRRSGIHGTGVFAARDIAAEEEILYYEGRVVTHAVADAQCVEDDEDGHTFLFTLNDQYVIDGGVDGNEARWINHSCDPNCEPVLEESDDGDPAKDRMVIQAVRAIRAGEELTYDYNLTTNDPLTDEVCELWACRCGASCCRGVMLDLEVGEPA